VSLNLCPVCEGSLNLKYQLRFRVYKCDKCGLYVSDASFDHSFVSNVDNTVRTTGLETLRSTNFKLIIDEIKRINGPRLSQIKGLEVGCGNGWWLKACKENGISCSGIEPELSFEPEHQAAGYDVTYGFYPQEKRDTLYDFIIFNDVFEHIPDVNALTASLNSDLKEGGYLIINIPLSDGLFSVGARILNRLGIKSFLSRMWQFDFHSPHCTYFNALNLNRLISKHGFTKVNSFRLNTLDFDTIQERVATDKTFNKLAARLMASVLMFAKPIINTSKPDIKVFFFKKDTDLN
jgi:SAM-dependent methyltransferase